MTLSLFVRLRLNTIKVQLVLVLGVDGGYIFLSRVAAPFKTIVVFSIIKKKGEQ